MKASELKNMPWEIQRDFESEKVWPAPFYEVLGNDGTTIAYMLDEPTAKAIASLPDTLKRLEELEEAAKAILNNWFHGDGKTRVADLMNNLKKALEE